MGAGVVACPLVERMNDSVLIGFAEGIMIEGRG
jgi:hypothetical protein